MARHSIAPSLVAMSLLLLPLAAAGQPQGTTCGNESTVVTGLNDAGQVVGWTGSIENAQGFVLDRHSAICQPIGAPANAVAVLPIAINDRGQIVGFYIDSAGLEHGFVYLNGGWTTIDHPGANGCQTAALGVNNRGQIVGYYDPSCTGGGGHDYPFLREPDGTFVERFPVWDDSAQADGINARGDIVGAWNEEPGEAGFLLEKDATVPLPFGVTTFSQVMPFSINAPGEVVGVAFVVWQDVPLGPACHGIYRNRDGDVRVSAMGYCTVGINASGEVSGTYFYADGTSVGFVLPLELLFPEP